MSRDEGPVELTGPFADIIRRLVRLGWLGHGDPGLRDLLAWKLDTYDHEESLDSPMPPVI